MMPWLPRRRWPNRRARTLLAALTVLTLAGTSCGAATDTDTVVAGAPPAAADTSADAAVDTTPDTTADTTADTARDTATTLRGAPTTTPGAASTTGGGDTSTAGSGTTLRGASGEPGAPAAGAGGGTVGASTTTAPLAPAPSTTSTAAPTPATAAPQAGTAGTAAGDPAWPLALDLLGFVPVVREQPAGYDRDRFGYPSQHGGGCDTRAKVLQRDSEEPPQTDPFGCTVVAGRWTSRYDGVVTTMPGDLHIDHVVALKEAWDSGAHAWDDARLRAFANDLTDARTLVAVTSGSNQAKSDKDPSNWLPTRPEAVCPYVGDWVVIKARWGLSMDESEAGRIRNLLRGSCAGLRVRPWSPAPAQLTVTSPPPQPTSPQPTSPEPAPAAPPPPAEPAPPPPAEPAPPPPAEPAPPPPAEVFYANCAAARAAGAAPLRVGQPGYRPALDRDGDGVACE